jgi:hypothetical protein
MFSLEFVFGFCGGLLFIIIMAVVFEFFCSYFMGASSIGFPEFYQSLSESCNVDNLKLDDIVEWIGEDFAQNTSVSPRLVVLIDEIMLSSQAAPVLKTSRSNLDDLIWKLCCIQDDSNGRVRFVISSLGYSAIRQTTPMTTNPGRHWIITFPLPTRSALSARCFILGSLIHQAVADGDLTRVAAIVEGLSVILDDHWLTCGAADPTQLRVRESDYRTPLLRACALGNVEMTAWLLEHGSNFEETTFSNKTVLMCAVESGNVDLVC